MLISVIVILQALLIIIGALDHRNTNVTYYLLLKQAILIQHQLVMTNFFQTDRSTFLPYRYIMECSGTDIE